MSGQGASGQQAQGPPYLPTTAGLGGLPVPNVDDPIAAVLLVFFIAGAAWHMTVLQINQKRNHKFIISGLTFGFCMARITALVMRIVWASRPTNGSIAIAANIFAAAGVVLLFVINLLFAQRILRAYHPVFGWHMATRVAFRFAIFTVIAMLIMVITATIQSFYTLDTDIRRIDRDIQLIAGTWLAVLAFLPIPIVLTAMVWPRGARPEKFGTGRLRTKVRLLLIASTLLTFGAGWRIGANFDARPSSAPGWYHHKAAYYIVNYVVELIVVYMYGLSRFDRRFHVPNGAAAPGDYAAGQAGKRTSTFSDRINSEAEAFGEDANLEPTEYERRSREREWEQRAQEELKNEEVESV